MRGRRRSPFRLFGFCASLVVAERGSGRKGDRHRGRSQSPFLPDPLPNSSAPGKSTTTAERGARTKGTAFETCVFSHSVRKPQAASQRSHHRSRVMWLRREPNNRSKPPISPSMSINPREHPGQTRPFAIRIKPDFSDEFSVRIFTRMMIGICWTRTRNDHRPVIEPHHAER